MNKPLIPMGAITGRPTRAELLENLDSYRQAGIDQFLLYPRSGLEVEYLGPEWLEICRTIVEYCAEHGMALWLYDEYNWPSGRCKGKVVKGNPAFASKKLVAFADFNFGGIGKQEAPGAEYFWTEISIPIYADVLDPAAVESFIALTHEIYYRHFGRHFGSTIKGIFSDEPSFIYPSAHHRIGGSIIELPYYHGLKDDYRQATGRALVGDLEAYLQGRPPAGLWEHFYALLGQRFCTAYLSRIRDWCTAHQVLSTGHLLCESQPRSAIMANGTPVDAMRTFAMPGLDEILSNSHFERIEWDSFKLLESAMTGPRTEALAELFALGPADMTLTKMRVLIYLSALHGINHYVTAVSALDARGNVEKAFYYNPVAPTQPWFRYAAVLNDSAAAAAALTRKPATAAIALRYPQRVTCRRWNHTGESPLPIAYIDLVRALIGAQWEFRLIGDEEAAAPSFRTILALTETGAREELSGRQFGSIAEVLAFLEETGTRRACLCHADGRRVAKVLLKSYDDGTVCLVNTADEALRGVTLGAAPFDLPRGDVAVFPRPPQPQLRRVLDLTPTPLAARLLAPNSRRCIFPDGKTLQLDVAAATAVRIVLRTYAGQVELRLDGQDVRAAATGSDLPFGLKRLYRESEVLTLSPGRHMLRLATAARDLPYLPAALLFGAFALGPDRVIRPLPAEPATAAAFFAANLVEYAGTAAFSGSFDLSGHDGIAFAHRDLAVELFLDGQSQGPRLWAPFSWEVPAAWRRPGVKVEVQVTTSVGPLFGNYPDYQPADIKARLNEWWPGGPCR